MVDEVVTQLLGLDEGLVALGQRTLDIGARSDVERRPERCAVRQRKGGAVKGEAVLPNQPGCMDLTPVGEADDRGPETIPLSGADA